MPSLQSELSRAGYSGGRNRTYVRIADVLRECDESRIKARNKLIKIASKDTDLVVGMIDMCIQLVLNDMRGGQSMSADNGHVPYTPSYEDGGHSRAADTGQHSVASASDGKGHCAAAQSQPNVAPPSDNLTKRTARVKAIIETAVSIFDTHRMRDGRSIGDIEWHELERMENTNKREAILLRLIRNHTVPLDEHSKVRDVINEETLQKLIQKSAELCDAY